MATVGEVLDGSIRIITEPTVYLVGKQVFDAAELDRFLGDHGVSWESDSEVAAEVITETAGRVCYMSFARWTSPSIRSRPSMARTSKRCAIRFTNRSTSCASIRS